MSQPFADDFDFDAFAELAKTDPQEFERRRQRLIDANIAAAPEHQQQKLRHLQCRADLVREGASSPMAATLRLSSMMWESVAGPGGLRQALNALVAGDGSLLTTKPDNVEKATVLPFPRAIPAGSNPASSD